MHSGCRRKARAFRKARYTNKRRDWLCFRRLKKSAQLTCRQSYNNYLTEIICSEPGGNKKLGALIKAKRCDQSGVVPLNDGGFVHSDSKTKANFLNRQFSAVFTDEGQGPLPDIGTRDRYQPSPFNGWYCSELCRCCEALEKPQATQSRRSWWFASTVTERIGRWNCPSSNVTFPNIHQPGESSVCMEEGSHLSSLQEVQPFSGL